MNNTQIHSSVSTIVDTYITTNLEPRGFTSSTAQYLDNVENEVTTLRLLDADSEIGTYQFYKQANGDLVVADYFDVGEVYGTYKEGKQFDEDYDLPITFEEINDILDIFITNETHGYIGIDSYYINHMELMKREGWTDRRIKREFGIVPLDEFDSVSYYRLNEVISKES